MTKNLRTNYLFLIIILFISQPLYAQLFYEDGTIKQLSFTSASRDFNVYPGLTLGFPKEKEGGKKMMNSPLFGGAVGFVIGGTGGVILGLTGKEWVLDNGKVVSRPIHAIVDMFIVATPTTIIGVIVGARKDRSTLHTSNFHAAIGGGWSSAMTYQTMINAWTISAIPVHIPHWFGYLHYPNGANSSTPYTWNLTLDYNLLKKLSIGLSFNNFVKQEIKGGTDHHQPTEDFEFAKGESYTILGDYIINPIKPENKTRLEIAGGVGGSLHNLVAGGMLGTIEYKIRRTTFTPYFRATADYYSRKHLSLQLKFGYRAKQTVTIPEQTDGTRTLIAHAINYRSLDITLGIRYHFNIE